MAIVFCSLSLLVSTQDILAQGNVASEVKGKPIRGEPIRKSKSSESSGQKQEPGTTASKPKTATNNGDFIEVSFDILSSYTFEVPDGVVTEEGKSNEQIPADVLALNKKKVSLTGFMLPLKVDNGLVSEMLIMKDQSMCCYGAQPRINDWVSVKMKGKGVKSVMDQAVTIYGELRVGEILENGYLVGIYEMTAEKMTVAE